MQCEEVLVQVADHVAVGVHLDQARLTTHQAHAMHVPSICHAHAMPCHAHAMRAHLPARVEDHIRLQEGDAPGIRGVAGWTHEVAGRAAGGLQAGLQRR
eukprot:scaffold126203_cov45-Phaeocystis_antarctica.AAC.1